MRLVRSLFALTLLLAGSAPAPVLAQRSWDEVVIRPEKLADGLWMLTGAGGNMALCAGPTGALLVDAQYGQVAEKIRAAADSLSGGVPIRLVLNTHYHGDHVNGDSAMAAHGAAIVAHANVLRRMSEEQRNTTFDVTFPAYVESGRPVVVFQDSIALRAGDRMVRVVHVPPAHTDGDAVAFFPWADVVHTGDLFFNGTYPVIDVSAGGSIGGMIRAVDRLLPAIGPHTRIVPGHGPLADREALLRYRAMLVTVRDRVSKLVRERKSLDQIVAAKPTADLDAGWGGGFMKPERVLTVVYSDLSRSVAR